jgi:hypothetical protein
LTPTESGSMPAFNLSAEPVSISPCDVLAKSAGERDLFTHAMLCDEDNIRNDVVHGAVLRCVHMGPPLTGSEASVHAVGRTDLTAVERRMIKSFTDSRFAERQAEEQRLKLLQKRKELRFEYVIFPAAVRPSATFPLWRFSCAGFVLQAYRAARIELLGEPLPQKSLDDLKQMYPQVAARLDDPETRRQLGIAQGDSWPVLLVGYLLHAFNRDADAIRGAPVVPTHGDEYFPRR